MDIRRYPSRSGYPGHVRLVIGTGTGALPVMDQVKREAQRREIELVIVPTVRTIELLKRQSADTSAILHVTC